MTRAAVPRSRSRQPQDQAHGLRQLFGGAPAHWVPLVHNRHVGFGGVVMERLCTALGELRRRTLVVDVADTASAPNPLARVDLAACVETLSDQVMYLAARGLPMHYLDARATTTGFLQAVASAVPRADSTLVHAGASDLRRLFARRTPRPVLMVGLRPDSLTEAYGSMKLLSQRLGPLTYDLVIVGDLSPRRVRATIERLGDCADRFLGAALGQCAVVDPATSARAGVGDDLRALVQAQCASAEASLNPDPHAGPAPLALQALTPVSRAAAGGRLN